MHRFFTETGSAQRQIVLFDHRGGANVRRLNRTGAALGATALVPLTWVVCQAGRNQIDIGPPAIAMLMTLVSLAGILVVSSIQLSHRFVTRLEAWPQSHLLLVRTAGFWHERVALANLSDFPFDRVRSLARHPSARAGAYHPIAIGPRRRLWLDLAGAASIAPPELWTRFHASDTTHPAPARLND